MKAAVLRELGRLDIEDVELAGPGPDEVRLRVSASGLCHSDYHVITGDLSGLSRPVLLGHEACGTIEAVGENVLGLKPGDFVTSCVSAYCGHCPECVTGHTNLCDVPPKSGVGLPGGTPLSRGGEPIQVLSGLGGFAEEMVVHQRAVTKMPDALPPEVAAVMGCAVLTGVGAAIHGAEVRAGSIVAVIGCGGVGLNVIQGARIAGARRIIAIDTKPAKLEQARMFGATDTILAGPDTVADVVELSGGGVDYAFEVIGLAETMRNAFLMLRKRGTTALIGVAPTGAQLTIPIFPFAFKEVRVVGSFMGSAPFQRFLPQLAEYYLNGRLRLDELISHRIGLNDINEGFARMASGEGARNVIVF